MEAIKKRILFKIYTIWFFKRVVPLIVIQVAILGVVLKIFANNVFVSKVLQNASQKADDGYFTFFKYLGLAFLNTHPLTQIVILIGLGIGALIIRDIVRSLLTYKTMWVRK